MLTYAILQYIRQEQTDHNSQLSHTIFGCDELTGTPSEYITINFN